MKVAITDNDGTVHSIHTNITLDDVPEVILHATEPFNDLVDELRTAACNERRQAEEYAKQKEES